MFHRVGPAAYKPNLDNTHLLCEAMGNPERGLRCIHIAGTNGKGSVSHMLASILQEAGYKTGLYTSPHLKDFRERIRINGQMVAEEWVADYVTRNKAILDNIKPSFFEMSTVMAFAYFKEMRTDIAVIETGLGGRLDSTNVLSPILSVITNIGMDHMNLLGDTIEKIATEKAGIIKKKSPVVIGEYLPATKGIFIEKANQEETEITFAADHYSVHVVHHQLLGESMVLDIYKDNQLFLSGLACDLTGNYQYKNICTVLQCFENLKASLSLNEKHLRNGLLHVMKNTGLKGRWQILSRNPLVICDTGHNEPGIKEVMTMLSSISFNTLRIVLGVVDDKDLNKILDLFPTEATYYFCKADIPRGMNAEVLQAKADQFGLTGKTYSGVREALSMALHDSNEDDLIFVGGSTFTVAEIV